MALFSFSLHITGGPVEQFFHNFVSIANFGSLFSFKEGLCTIACKQLFPLHSLSLCISGTPSPPPIS